MSHPNLVRPVEVREIGEMDEMSDEELAHQKEAYRKAWEPFNPDNDEAEGGDKGTVSIYGSTRRGIPRQTYGNDGEYAEDTNKASGVISRHHALASEGVV